MAGHMLRYSMVGSPETVESSLHAFIDKHQPNELMFTSLAYDQAARLRSLEIVANIAGHL